MKISFRISLNLLARQLWMSKVRIMNGKLLMRFIIQYFVQIQPLRNKRIVHG